MFAYGEGGAEEFLRPREFVERQIFFFGESSTSMSANFTRKVPFWVLFLPVLAREAEFFRSSGG